MANSMTIVHLRDALIEREPAFHPPGSERWIGSDWSNAMCGEAGEAANVVKKLRRIETRVTGIAPESIPESVAIYKRQLAWEIADMIMYAFHLADHYVIDVEQALIEKFNVVSEMKGLPHRLP